MVLDKALSKYGNTKYIVAIVLLVLHDTVLKDISNFTINRTSYFYVFFILVRILRQNYEKVMPIVRKRNIVILIFIVIYVASFWIPHTSSAGKPMPYLLNQIIMPLSPCGFLWLLAIKAEKFFEGGYRIFRYFGKYSLQFYLNHMLVLLFAFYVGKAVFLQANSYYFSLVALFGTTITISYIMLQVEKKLIKLKVLFGL